MMQKAMKRAVDLVEKASSIKVVTHLDADGLSAGGILSQALKRGGKEVEVEVLPGVYQNNVPEEGELTIFSDLGSGQLDLLEKKYSGKDVIILDHHQPSGPEWPSLVHVNPCLVGVDGANDISGAGVSYLFAKALDKENKDLSKLAVVGAVGDIQNFWGKFTGINAAILQDAVHAGQVSTESDLLLYGRFTRPLFKSMQYFTDPFVPDVSNSESGCISLLQMLGIDLKDGTKWRSLSDLNKEEKAKISGELISRALTMIPEELSKYVPGLVIGDVYNIQDEEKTPELMDASEFSTCLNATGRNKKPEVGLRIACGNRGEAYKELKGLLRMHRRNIAKGLSFVEETGVKTGPENYLQYFDALDEIKPNIIGTIAGLMLGNEGTDPYKPIVGMARTSAGVKVSARSSRILVLKGVDMASAIRVAALSVGGRGGGHTVACGATIPEEEKEKFIKVFEKELVKRL